MPSLLRGDVATRLRSIVLTALLALSSVGCPTDVTEGDPDPTDDIASVDVSAPRTTIEVGETLQLGATARDDADQAIAGRTFVWVSGNAATATVGVSTGLVTGVAPGSALITAADDATGVFGSVMLEVVPAAVQTVTLSPAEASLVEGDTAHFTVVLRDARNAVLSGRDVAWSSSDVGVATVDASGVVTGVAAGGPVTIVVSAEGVSDSAQVTVQPVPVAAVTVQPDTTTLIQGESYQFGVTLTSATGDTLTGRTIAWSSSNDSIASVDGAGLVSGLGVGGPVTITATSEGLSGSASVMVAPVPVEDVVMEPDTASIVAGDSLRLSAFARSIDGDTLVGRGTAWTSADAAIASVDSTGLVRAHAVGGPVLITATIDGRSASALITVTPVPVARVVAEPAVVEVQQRQTAQLSAVALDAQDSVLDGRVVTWSSADTAIATVDAAGLVTGVGVGGPVFVIATIEGVSDSVAVTVSAIPVATVVVSPDTATLVEGQTVALGAITLDAAGDTLTGRIVTWTSADTTVASVDASGFVMAHAAGGPVTISATSEGVAGTATITVVAPAPAPVATVIVSPDTTTLVEGQTVALGAVTLDAAGDTLTGRVVTWTSADTAVASVDASGLVTAHAAGGPVTISATSEGVVGSATITVVAPAPDPVATVVVSPDSAALFPGDSAGLAAVTLTAAGDTLTDRAVAWQTRDGAVASVDTAGVVTAHAVGETWVVATSEAASDSARIVVSRFPVATVDVTPDAPAIVVAATQALDVLVLSANGDTLTDRTVTWASRDSAVASVDSAGLVSGHAVGAAWIVASAEGVADSVQVTVSPAPVASVTVTPDSAVAYIAATLQLDALALDSNGDTMTAAIVWTTLHPTLASVDSTGLVSGIGAGAALIVATLDGVADTAQVEVRSPITAIVVTPDSVTLTALGATQAYGAVAYDTAGAPMTGVVFDWQSMNPLVASVSPATGETTTAQAIDAGVTQIRASALGWFGEVTLRVGQFAATIDAAPDSITLTVGGYATLTADVRDGSGAPIEDAQPIWRASNAVVFVDSLTGTIRGASLGTSLVWAELDGVSSDSAAVTVSNVAPPSLSFGARAFQVGKTSTVSMPIYLSTAPTDSVVVLLTSADTAYAKFEPARVVFGAGQTQANASLRGVTVGELNVWAIDEAGTYGGDTVRVQVQNVATLTFLRMGYVGNYVPAMHVGETYRAELRLSDPAPAGGLYFTLSGAGVEFDPATLYVPAGQLVAQFDLTGLYPATANISAQAGGTTAALITTTVLAAELQFYLPSTGAPGTYYIGRGQSSIGGTVVQLTTPTHLESAVTVALAYDQPALVDAQPSVLLETTGPGTSGKDSESIPFSALATGTTTLTASAPGWTDGVATVVVTSPMFVMNAGSGSRDLLEMSSIAAPATLYASSTDSLGAGHPVVNDEAFEMWSGDTTIVRVLTPGAVMPAGQQSYQQLQVEAVGPGTTWVYTGGTGILTDSIQVVVTAPSIVADRQELVATPGYGIGMRLTMSDRSNPLLYLSSSDTMVAAVDSTKTVSNGYTDIQVRSRQAGTATLIVSAPGYHPDTIQVRTAAGWIQASAQPLVMFQEGAAYGTAYDSAGTGLIALDTARMYFTVVDTTVAAADAAYMEILPGASAGAVMPLRTVGAGTTDIIITMDGFASDTIQLVVSPAELSWWSSEPVLPRHQATSRLNVRLPAARDVDVVLRFTHADATLMALAADSVVIPAGQTEMSITWESFGIVGQDTIVASADGYATARQPVEVVESRILPGSFQPGDHRTTMPPQSVMLGLGAVGHANLMGQTTIPVTIRVESTDSSVIVPDSGAIHFQPGDDYRWAPVRFVGPGTARLIYTDSAGVYAADSSGVVTVVAPVIEVASTWPNYYTGGTGFLRLGMQQMNTTVSSFMDAIVRLPDAVVGEDLVIRLVSSDTSVVTVPDSVIIPIGSSSVPFRVVAQDTVGSIAIYAEATGLQQGRMNVDVVQPTMRMGVNTSYTMYAVDDPIHVQVITSNANGNDNPPAQDLVLNVTSSDPSVIAVVSSTIVIPAGTESYFEPILRMVGTGTATITISDPRTGFVDYGSTNQAITINAP